MTTIQVNNSAFITIDGNVLTSEGLKDACPYCSCENCYADCDGSAGDIDGLESEEQMNARRVSNAAIDGLEALLLAGVQAGAIDPASEKTKEAIITALDAIANNLG